MMRDHRGAALRGLPVVEKPSAFCYSFGVTDQAPTQIPVHALQIADRVNPAGFEGEILSSTPLAVRIGASGLAVVFRYGAVVFLGLTADQETEFLERLHSRCVGKVTPYEEEWAKVQVAREGGEPIPVGGPILV